MLENVPRTSKLSVRPLSGYPLMAVLTSDAEEILLSPLSLTIYAFDEAKDRETVWAEPGEFLAWIVGVEALEG